MEELIAVSDKRYNSDREKIEALRKELGLQKILKGLCRELFTG